MQKQLLIQYLDGWLLVDHDELCVHALELQYIQCKPAALLVLAVVLMFF